MAIIVEGVSKKAIGSPMEHATDASAAFTRYEPLLTPQQLRERHLPGIPLAAQHPDPVTKQRFVFSDTLIKDYIFGAIAKVELETGLRISPMEVKRRIPFDRNEYMSLGYFRAPDAPILRVTSLALQASDGSNFYTLDPTWLEPGYLQQGRFNLIPITPAYLGAGTPSGSMQNPAGGNFILTILANMAWVPALWTVTYITGFDEGAIPRVINELVGCQASIDILLRLAATNRVASYSLGIDGASQSVSTAGVQVYEPVIAVLQDEKKTIVSKLKAKFAKKLFSDNV